MNNFIKHAPKDLHLDPITEIGQKWMLLTASKPDGSFNTMTASWGGIGVLWNKPVAFIFIRPQRYTKEFVDASDYLTASFYKEEYRPALTFCGRNSGRTTDKVKETGLTPAAFGEGIAFEEAERVLLLKKLYCGRIDPTDFTEKDLDGVNYTDKDYHAVYVCEIVEGYEKV